MAEYTTRANTSNGTSYLTTDHLGSTRLVTGQDGTVKARHDYLPFGEELQAGIGGRTSGLGYTADNLNQKFVQEERDSESGLDYFGQRYFSSAQGRFITVDPVMGSAIVADPQSFNRYTYVLNNPLRYVDPDGLSVDDPWSTLTDEERRLLASKLTAVRKSAAPTPRELAAAGAAFNGLVSTNGGNTLSAEQIANNVVSVQNFVKQLGSDSKVWDQVSVIVKVIPSGGDNNQSDISFDVKNKTAFFDAMKESKDPGGNLRFIYMGLEQGHKDSTRGVSESTLDPSIHLESYTEKNLYTHWDPTTAISKDSLRDIKSGSLPVGIAKMSIGGLAHFVVRRRAHTSSVTEFLIREAQTPKH